MFKTLVTFDCIAYDPWDDGRFTYINLPITNQTFMDRRIGIYIYFNRHMDPMGIGSLCSPLELCSSIQHLPLNNPQFQSLVGRSFRGRSGIG